MESMWIFRSGALARAKQAKALPSAEPKFRGHDGGSYAASRSIIGHAPGMPKADLGLDHLSAAHDEGRADPMPAPECHGMPSVMPDERGRYRCLPASETGVRETAAKTVMAANVPSAAYKPVHGGYPTPRKAEVSMIGPPTSPIPGSDWSVDAYTTFPEASIPYNEMADMEAAVDMQMIEDEARISGNTKFPSIYFDGVRMETTLNRMANEASSRAWAITTAVRNLRLAETGSEQERAKEALQIAMDKAISEYPHLRVAMEVDAIADTINGESFEVQTSRTAKLVSALQAFIRSKS